MNFRPQVLSDKMLDLGLHTVSLIDFTLHTEEYQVPFPVPFPLRVWAIELHDADHCLEEETLRLPSKAGRK
jgi:hypothetical protein